MDGGWYASLVTLGVEKILGSAGTAAGEGGEDKGCGVFARVLSPLELC